MIRSHYRERNSDDCEPDSTVLMCADTNSCWTDRQLIQMWAAVTTNKCLFLAVFGVYFSAQDAESQHSSCQFTASHSHSQGAALPLPFSHLFEGNPEQIKGDNLRDTLKNFIFPLLTAPELWLQNGAVMHRFWSGCALCDTFQCNHNNMPTLMDSLPPRFSTWKINKLANLQVAHTWVVIKATNAVSKNGRKCVWSPVNTGRVFRNDNILEKSGGTHSMVTFSCPGMVWSLLFSGLTREKRFKVTTKCHQVWVKELYSKLYHFKTHPQPSSVCTLQCARARGHVLSYSNQALEKIAVEWRWLTSWCQPAAWWCRQWRFCRCPGGKEEKTCHPCPGCPERLWTPAWKHSKHGYNTTSRKQPNIFSQAQYVWITRLHINTLY